MSDVIASMSEQNALDTECSPSGKSITSIQLSFLHLDTGIQKLPVEILCEIFTEYAHAHPFDLWDSKDGPRLLESVCSLWRATVISSPRAWSRFVVISRPETCTIAATKALRTHLQRSAASPLTFSFYTGYTTSNTNPLLDVLLDDSHRWHDVMLELPVSLYPSLDRIRHRVPLLHTLSLRAKRSAITGIQELAAFQDAPALKKLALWGNWSTVHSLDFPWEQLTSYADEDGSATCPHSLLSMVNVTNLTYRPKRTGYIHLDVDTRRLYSLRSLRILSGPHLDTFLDHTVMPSLEQVTLDDMCSHYQVKTVVCALESLLHRSRCSIRVLNIDNIAVGDTPHLLHLFQSMPNLTSLSIRHWSSLELSKLFQELRQNHSLLPKLKAISLHSDLATAIGDVVDMVEARWNIGNGGDNGEGQMQRLESVECLRYPVYESPSLKRLRALAQKGLDVCFRNRMRTWY